MNIKQEIKLLASEDQQLDKKLGKLVHPIQHYENELFKLYIKTKMGIINHD
tara:strand:+ start:1014 stop:1166 length:153 start_codon:yes stop_codon:yes gene_type:complete